MREGMREREQACERACESEGKRDIYVSLREYV